MGRRTDAKFAPLTHPDLSLRLTPNYRSCKFALTLQNGRIGLYRVMRFLDIIIGLSAIGGHFVAVAIYAALFAQEIPNHPAYALASELFADRLMFSSGMDQTENAQTTYGTADVALFTKHSEEGWRLKLFGSHTQFQYSSTQVYCAASAEEKKSSTGTNFSDLCNDIANASLDAETRKDIAENIAPFGLELTGDQIYFRKAHRGIRYEFAVLPGYQFILGQFVIKGYAGVAYQHQSVLPEDPANAINGDYWGAKGAVELWARLNESAWLSVDGSYFEPTSSYSGSLRVGYDVLSWLTVGPQFAAFGDLDGNSGRAGGFLSLDLMGSETTLSAGMSSNYKDDSSLYGSANVFVKF